jgi:hypothetical protein
MKGDVAGWRGLLLVWGLLAGCGGDAPIEGETDAPVETEVPPGPPDVVGAWLAEGDDIGEGLQGDGARLLSITSRFAEDGTYANDLALDDGSTVQTSGVYVIDATTLPWGIVLDQQLPAPEPLNGIGELQGDVLRLDLISPFAYEPTTPEQGIGGGALGEASVITLRRQ